jgi:hypothetical protein
LEACDALPAELRAACAAKCEAEGIDGNVLSTLTEAELGACCALLPPKYKTERELGERAL